MQFNIQVQVKMSVASYLFHLQPSGGSRTAATSKIERFVIFDVAAVLDPPVQPSEIQRCLSLQKILEFRLIFCRENFLERHSFRIVLGESSETIQKKIR